MKRMVFGASVAALVAGPAWAQVQADAADNCAGMGDGDVLAICAQPAFGSNDEIVVVADRLGYAAARDLTVPASVLTEQQIAARGQQYVSELLRALPGIAVSTSGPGGGLTQLRVRGAEANQVLVLIDGVEVANPSTGEFDLSGLRAADVVKIEVLRGEQSALYGSDAVAGVISIVTRAGEVGKRWRAGVEAGSRDTAEAQVTGVVPLGNAALSLGGTLFTTDGYDISGLDGERDGSRSRALNIGLNRVELGGARLDFKFGVSRLETEFDEDSDFDGRLQNTDSETEVNTRIGRADLRFGTGALDHKLSLGYLETDTDTQAGFSTRSIGERMSATYVGGFTTGAHRLTGLAEYERETYRIEPNFTEDGAEPENEVGAIAGDYRYTSGDLTLSASARHDINDLFQDATTWRLGAGHDLPWDGRIRASVGTGVKNPSLIELFGFFPGSRFTGNADLQPERSTGVSVGYEQRVGDFEASVDVFHSELENEITTLFNPDFTTSVVNLETDSTRSGVELEASYDLGDIRLQGAATFLDSEQDGQEEIRRPDFSASLSGAWQATDALLVSAHLDHTGSQLDTDFATFSAVELDSFTVLGARAVLALGDHATLSLRGENLLDENYQEIVGFAAPGRAVFIGLSGEF